MKKLIDVMRRHLVVTMLVVFMAGFGACYGANYVYNHEVLYPNFAEDLSMYGKECSVYGYVYGLLDGANGNQENYYKYGFEEMWNEVQEGDYHYLEAR